MTCTPRCATASGRVNSAVRKAMTEERKAKDRLPPDTRGLVLIMAEIGRGGMNGAVIAIEEARGQLSAALAEPAPSPGTYSPDVRAVGSPAATAGRYTSATVR